MKKCLIVLSLAAGLGLLAPGGTKAAEVNWENVRPYKVKLFYPGTTSWEFLNSKDHGVGMVPVVKRKKGCQDCHIDKDGNLDVRASEIVNGSLSMKVSKKPFEPNPVEGKPGLLDAELQAAYDDENIYLRLQWNSAGKTWKGEGGSPDRVSIQVNSSQDEFSKYGCFVTCHSDQNSMPESPDKDKVSKHPYYSKQKRDDVRLYASYTRTGGWADMKDSKEIDETLKGGGLIDLWEATFKGKGVETSDGWILEDREEDHKDIEVSGEWGNGKYTVTMKRKLKTSDTKDIELKPGATFTTDIAIHDDKAKLRKHYVSYPISIGMGTTDGMVKATKLR